MSEPSIQNIDKWMFELHEGNLSPGQEEMLMDFVARNPEFKNDLESWSQASVSEEKFIYNTAHLLRNKRKIAPIFYVSISLIVGLSLGAAFFLNDSSKARYQSTNLNADVLLTTEQLQSQNFSETDLFKSNSAIQHSISGSKDLTSAYSNQSTNKGGGDVRFNPNGIPLNQNSFESQSISYTNISSEENEGNSESGSLVSTELESLVASLDKSNINGLTNDTSISGQTNDKASTNKEDENNREQVSIKKEFSLKRSVYKWSRSLNRAMSNPVALKNFRDAYYTLPSATAFELNSAFVGTQIAPKLQLSSRAQYLGNNTQKLDNTLFFDAYVPSLKGGIGVDVNYHTINQGAVDGMEVGLSYSPKISLGSKLSFEPSMRFKIGNKQINPDKLASGTVLEAERGRPVQYFNEGETPVGKNLWYRDVQLGFLVNTPWFYIGGSVDNVNRHYNNIYSNEIDNNYTADRLFSAQLGTDYKSYSKKTKLATYMVYQAQSEWQELWLGANINHRSIHFGVAANDNIDLALSAGVDAKKLRFIYNIDYSESRVDQKKYVSHQLTLRYKLKPNRNARRILNM